MILLAIVEMTQRFALWGVGNLLVLYLLQSHGMDMVTAERIFGVFLGAAFALPIVGGYIADRWDYHHATISGCVLTSIGCFFLATNVIGLVYVGLVCIALGGCIFTPSIYTLLGSVYHDKHYLREAGFSIYYASVNIGVFAAMIILGLIGNSGHWNLAFFLAGLIQLAGLFPLYKALHMPGLRRLHHGGNHFTLTTKGARALTPKEKSRVIVIVILSVISFLFWLCYNQGGSSLTIFAKDYTDRMIGTFEMPPSWLLACESLFLIILAIPLAMLYIYLAKRKKDPSPPVKTGYSLVSMAICFLIMVIVSTQIPIGAKTADVSVGYPIVAYFFMALGEMLLAPIGLSLVTHISPPRFTAFLVGLWYVCIGLAFFMGGIVATWMSWISSLETFFFIFVIITLIPAAFLFVFSKKLNEMRHLDSL